MSETGLTLPAMARGTLLSVGARVERLRAAIPQILAVVEGEEDAVALQATLACLLSEAFPQTHWCGFYRRIGPSILAVGPYQGTLGCLRIDFARGVCGACARSGEVQIVPDVDVFPNHIACDDRTRSELVVPVHCGGELRAVLDLDSPHLDAFDTVEAKALLELVKHVFDQPSVRW